MLRGVAVPQITTVTAKTEVLPYKENPVDESILGEMYDRGFEIGKSTTCKSNCRTICASGMCSRGANSMIYGTYVKAVSSRNKLYPDDRKSLTITGNGTAGFAR